jgi:hypothetical protein
MHMNYHQMYYPPVMPMLPTPHNMPPMPHHMLPPFYPHPSPFQNHPPQGMGPLPPPSTSPLYRPDDGGRLQDMPSTCPSIAVSVSQQPHYPSVVVPEATAAIPEEHTAPSRIFSAGSLKPLGHKFEDGVLKVLYDEEDLKRWKAEKGIVEHVRDEGKDKHAGLGAGGNEQADGGVVLLPVSTGGHEPLTTNSHNNAVAHTEDEQEDDTVKHSGTGLTVTPVVLPAQSSLR